MQRLSIATIAAALLAAPAFAQSTDAPKSGPSLTETLGIDPETGAAILQEAQEPEKPKWTGSVNASGSLSQGNTNKRTAGVAADAERRGEDDRLTLGFAWNYSDEKDATKTWTISQRRTRGNAKYDYFLAEKTYAYVNASAENDKFSDLNLRLVLGAGAGRQFYEEDDFKLSAELGLAYYDEDRYVGMDEDYVAARVAYSLEYTPRDNITFLQDVEALPGLEDAADIYVRKDSRIRLTVTDRMFTQFQWVLDYDNTPAAGLDRVDHLFLIGVGWEF
ncbi:MAG: DUF481 domain-containing protein [Planctomycetes bacterium]|nr:DUF481 domain-containing protein [Planctomycetota bacterium]